jgi:putative transposase
MQTDMWARIKGGCYFFTVNLAGRRGNDLLLRHIENLRVAFRETQLDHPFTIDGIVILPDRLNCLWRLPPDDDDFPTRWRLIESRLSRHIEGDSRRANIEIPPGQEGTRTLATALLGTCHPRRQGSSRT